jgi:uridylate kinase
MPAKSAASPTVKYQRVVLKLSGEVLRGRRGAAIRHMHDVDAGVQLQQFRCDVAGGAGAL